MERPTRDEVCMSVAQAFALRSTCSRAHVGVVIAREGRILSTGYNGVPPGMEHCDHRCDCVPTEVREFGMPGIAVRSVHRDHCNSKIFCTGSVHAEANAIAFAARYGTKIDGADLFTTLTPCLACAQLIASACIARVVALDPYRDQTGWEFLRQAKIDIVRF